MKQPNVTIIVVPRERYSLTPKSLESLYANTKIPFNLIYVDAASPREIRTYLNQQAQEKGFKYIRANQFLFPTQARNIALKHVETPFVVFVENDCLFAENWLDKLLECAIETGAEVVSPLLCERHDPPFKTVHCAGGDTAYFEEKINGVVKKGYKDEIYGQRKDLSEVLKYTKRAQTGLMEFHAVLVKTDFLKKLGGFDEGAINTKEHLDFSLCVKKAGGKIYLEPESLVTYISHLPLESIDLKYYLLRWNNRFARQSILYLCNKWEMDPDSTFMKKRSNLGWRRTNFFYGLLLKGFKGNISKTPFLFFLFRSITLPVDFVIDACVYHYHRSFLEPKLKLDFRDDARSDI